MPSPPQSKEDSFDEYIGRLQAAVRREQRKHRPMRIFRTVAVNALFVAGLAAMAAQECQPEKPATFLPAPK